MVFSRMIGFPTKMEELNIAKKHRFGEFDDTVFLGRITALGCDDAGNLYIAQDLASHGGGTIRECLSAHQRQNGEYVIFLEDDYKAKIIMYRMSK